MRDKVSQVTEEAWWAKPLLLVLTMYGANATDGLSPEAVNLSREKFGANTLDEVKPLGSLALIIEGVREPNMEVLLSIAKLSFIFGKIQEAIVMIFVVITYIAVEFINKHRTDRMMTRLPQQ